MLERDVDTAPPQAISSARVPGSAASPGGTVRVVSPLQVVEESVRQPRRRRVDLYGGTRHSSATALRSHFSPEQIKSATMHATNVAFERYFQTGPSDLKALYAAARVDPRLTPEEGTPPSG
jgi:hypothetical protein